MGHQLCYVILENGRRVNLLLQCGASDAHMDASSLDHGLCDFWIDGTGTSLLAELSGAVTVLYAPVRYSMLLQSQTLPETIRQLESILKQRLGRIVSFRCDEWLLNEWIASREETWCQSMEAAQDFVSWLATQPTDQWQKL